VQERECRLGRIVRPPRALDQDFHAALLWPAAGDLRISMPRTAMLPQERGRGRAAPAAGRLAIEGGFRGFPAA
jgi:hypothetical protein